MSGFPVQSAKLIHLIETTETRGDGTKTDPVRTAKSYWTQDGELLKALTKKLRKAGR